MAFPSAWARKQKITIQAANVNGSGSHIDFPMLITQDHLNAEIIDAGLNSALNGGGDIRFSSDSAGTSQLAIEIVSFVTNAAPASRKCEIWVKIPSVSTSVDSDIYIWYKKSGEIQPAVTAPYGRDAVWADYSYVLHLGSGLTSDSTGNHAIIINGSPVVSGGWMSFDGVDDYIRIADATSLDETATQTLTCYARRTGTGGMSIQRKRGGSGGGGLKINGSGGYAPVYTKFNIADYTFANETWDATNGNIANLVVTVGKAYHYIDMDVATTKTISTTNSQNNSDLLIANYQTSSGGLGGYSAFDIKRIRFSNSIVRNADFISTEANNQLNPATFATAATPVAVGGGVTALVIQGSTCPHNTDNVTLQQQQLILIDVTNHDHLADILALLQNQLLVISGSLHGHGTGNLTFSPAMLTLTIQNALHGHLGDNVGLIQNTALMFQENIHAHNSDGLDLQIFFNIGDSLHVLTNAPVALSQIHDIVIQFCDHMTFNDVIALINGINQWTDQPQGSAIWTDQSKNNSNWSDQAQNTNPWTNH